MKYQKSKYTLDKFNNDVRASYLYGYYWALLDIPFKLG
jgi:hypothetical protein